MKNTRVIFFSIVSGIFSFSLSAMADKTSMDVLADVCVSELKTMSHVQFFQCGKCPRQYRSKTAKEAHYKRTHRPKTLEENICKRCRKPFTDRGSLKMHNKGQWCYSLTYEGGMAQSTIYKCKTCLKKIGLSVLKSHALTCGKQANVTEDVRPVFLAISSDGQQDTASDEDIIVL